MVSSLSWFATAGPARLCYEDFGAAIRGRWEAVRQHSRVIPRRNATGIMGTIPAL
jgi:hypothetical protein